jgi:hypothetical protein
VFHGEEWLARSPFLDRRWPILLFPETLPRRVAEYFDPLRCVAQGIGDDFVYLAEQHEPHIWFTTSWSPDEFRKTRLEIPLGALLFGSSTRWGALLTDEHFTCVGAELDIISQIADACGGQENIRREMEDFLDELIVLDPDEIAAIRQLNRWEPEGA